MFVLISKSFDFLLAPLTWGFGLVSLGLWLVVSNRRRRLGIGLSLGGLLVTWGFATEPAARLLGWIAERPPADTYRSGETYDAVIVLGGYIDVETTDARGRLELTDAADRLAVGVELLATGHARQILFTGGNVWGSGTPEAAVAARWAERTGIQRDRIVVETASRNTRENARETAKIARRARWRRLVLVTSASVARHYAPVTMDRGGRGRRIT